MTESFHEGVFAPYTFIRAELTFDPVDLHK